MRHPGAPTARPRVRADLAAAGVRTSRKRVARLMGQAGDARGSPPRRISLTRRDRAACLPPDLVGRGFPECPIAGSGSLSVVTGR